MSKRREFIKQVGIFTWAVLALNAGIIEGGCTFGSVMANLAKFLPIGLNALAGVAALISPGAGTAITPLIGLVNVAWGALQGAVNDYNSAPAASKQTTLEKVLLALDEVQQYLAQTYQQVGITAQNSPPLKAAEAALLVITTTLGAIEAQLAPQAAPPTASMHVAHAQARSVSSVEVNGIAVQVTGKPQDFKTTYNTIMQNAGRSDLKLH
jgi:hypothetical protein